MPSTLINLKSLLHTAPSVPLFNNSSILFKSSSSLPPTIPLLVFLILSASFICCWLISCCLCCSCCCWIILCWLAICCCSWGVRAKELLKLNVIINNESNENFLNIDLQIYSNRDVIKYFFIFTRNFICSFFIVKINFIQTLS